MQWTRQANPPANPKSARGALRAPFDLREVELEQAPRGTITLTGLRGEDERSWVLPLGPWGLAPQPMLSGEALERLEVAEAIYTEQPAEAARAYGEVAQLVEGRVALAVVAWLRYQQWYANSLAGVDDLAAARSVVAQIVESGHPHLAARVAAGMASVFPKERQDEAASLGVMGFEILEREGTRSLVAAAFLDWLATDLSLRGKMDPALSLARAALEYRRQLAPGSLPAAESLSRVALLEKGQGNHAEAVRLYRQAQEIHNSLLPISEAAAKTLEDLATAEEARGYSVAADEARREAAVVREALSSVQTSSAAGPPLPGAAPPSPAADLLAWADSMERSLGPSLSLARSFIDLARQRESMGEPELAESLLGRAIEILEEVDPSWRRLPEVIAHWGFLASLRGDLKAAESRLRRALERAEILGPHSLQVADVLRSLVIVAQKRRGTDAAVPLQERALEIRRVLAPGSVEMADSLNGLALQRRARGESSEAVALYLEALEVGEAIGPGCPSIGLSLLGLGGVASEQGNSEQAALYFRRLLDFQQSTPSAGGDVAFTLHSLAQLERERGDLLEAERHQRQCVDLRRRGKLGSPDLAESLNELGLIVGMRGDLAQAQALFREALEIWEHWAPQSTKVAMALNNLGQVAHTRGDLARAEGHYRDALTIEEELDPVGLSVATCLNNLGQLLHQRGESEAGEALLRRALNLKEAAAPGGPSVATSWNNLALLAVSRGQWGEARSYLERALKVYGRAAPGGLEVASIEDNLGQVALNLGENDEAVVHAERALAIRERLAPDSKDVALSLNNLGFIAYHRGELDEAAQYLRRALVLGRKTAPEHLHTAATLHSLGTVLRARGNLERAADRFCRAINVLERQRGRLGGSGDVKAGFGANYRQMYRDCASALVQLGNTEEAFAVLERSRAQSFLQMLSERDLLFAEDVPAELRDEQRLADAAYDRLQGELATADDVKATQVRAQLHEVANRRESVKQRIKEASPRYAALQYPEPLDLSGVRGALDEGTVYLSYSVGETTSTLYVVQPLGAEGGERNGLLVIPLSAGDEELRQKVAAFRSLVSGDGRLSRGVVVSGESGRGGDSDVSLQEQARKLYDLLVRPAEGQVASAKRVLISADGPLHAMPFGALLRTAADGDDGFLIEWRPIHVVVSATVYAELRRASRTKSPWSAREGDLVAFGDPDYREFASDDAGRAADPEVRLAVRSGLTLQPLPFTRQEVVEIAREFGPAARVYLGQEATESRAKQLGLEGARYVHFATHGLLDERFPLNSALVLSIPEKPVEGQDNGLLQAWEIFEQVRLDADLVVLSACETALGAELGGEGLIGLTRAFQYAGARSVVASLWSVADRSTAELMKTFYGNLKEGKTKDEALRQAQLRLLEKPSTAHPFHWAAFEVFGDWR